MGPPCEHGSCPLFVGRVPPGLHERPDVSGGGGQPPRHGGGTGRDDEGRAREVGRAGEGDIGASSSGSGGGGDDGDGDGGEGDDMVRKIGQFQEWLSGIPGIVEATALASAIEHIESDRYDLIVCCRPGSRSSRGGNPPFGDTGTCSRGWDRPRP